MERFDRPLIQPEPQFSEAKFKAHEEKYPTKGFARKALEWEFRDKGMEFGDVESLTDEATGDVKGFIFSGRSAAGSTPERLFLVTPKAGSRSQWNIQELEAEGN